MNACFLNNQKMALLAGLSAAVIAGAVLVQPSISAFAASQAATGSSSDKSDLTTLEDRGEFEYFCELHPNMVGTVTVD